MPNRPGPRAFIFAGGGTGGHIIPALAILHHLRELLPDAEARIVCSDRPIDARILSGEPVAFTPAPAKPFGLRPRTLARFLWNWGPSVRLGRALIADAQTRLGRDAVRLVAMGGFVAAPLVQAARAQHCPVMLVNLDAAPGKANRWIASRADAACSTFPVNARFARGWEVIRPIVRPLEPPVASASEARSALGLDPGRPVLLVTGGSQGAGSINALMLELARLHPAALAAWQVLHQTGQDDNAPLEQAYAQVGSRAIVARYVPNLGLWWRAADLALSRAGAGSVADAWAAHTPAIFMPYPWHADQHQARNAAVLVEPGAAIQGVDRIDPAANLSEAGAALLGLMTDPGRRQAMREASVRLGEPDGARRVAERLASF